MIELTMPPFLPQFAEGEAWRRLHPTKEGRRRWRFVTLESVRVGVGGLMEWFDTIADLQADHGASEVMFCDASGKAWMRFDPFGIWISPGYAWNGCTPKRWVWPFGWVGTPDWPSTILASLVHDALYQFHATADFHLTRRQVDGLFRHIIEASGAPGIACTYWSAVRACGRWRGQVRANEYSRVL